ncbi:MAG TPA: hypothetical protein VNI01_10465 [Elusimicrobiota bacterium]|nr:hypothetical protein [Elusimicrobiota bacterium]
MSLSPVVGLLLLCAALPASAGAPPPAELDDAPSQDAPTPPVQPPEAQLVSPIPPPVLAPKPLESLPGAGSGAQALLDAMGSAIRDLGSRGFGTLPSGLLARPDLARGIGDFYEAWSRRHRRDEEPEETFVLFEGGARGRWGARGVPAKAADSLEAFAKELAAQVNRKLPIEELFIERVELRFARGQPESQDLPRFDRDAYLSALLEFFPDGPAATFYEVRNTRARGSVVPGGVLVLVNGTEREAGVGAPAAAHGDARRSGARSAALTVRLACRGGLRRTEEDVLADQAQRFQAVLDARGRD